MISVSPVETFGISDPWGDVIQENAEILSHDKSNAARI